MRWIGEAWLGVDVGCVFRFFCGLFRLFFCVWSESWLRVLAGDCVWGQKSETKIGWLGESVAKKIGTLKVGFKGRWGETGFGTVGKHSCKAEQSLRAKSIPNGAERDAFVRFK